jgi:hypothetical protein
MDEAADIMVRTGKTVKEALTELGVSMTTSEAEGLLRRRSFQQLLRIARNRFDSETAADPGRNKQSTIGRLQNLADLLMQRGEYEKAAEVLFKLSKLENWVGEGGSVNVFAGLTQKDLDEMRRIVNEQRASAGRDTEVRPGRASSAN